jgi:hypothetical protein
MAIQRSSVISRTRSATAAAPAEVSEFDGLWLNFGVNMGDGETSTFVRLPRGVAVDDLKTKKIYDRQIAENPDYAAEVQLMNNLITLIQDKALTLAEGESIPLNLEVQLYRRQEASEDVAPTKQDLSELGASIFG